MDGLWRLNGGWQVIGQPTTGASLRTDPGLTPNPAEAAPVRVLVVDDSAVIRGVITKQLAGDPGIEVVGSASDGEQAVRKVAALPVDVVVLDIEMPVMDGLTALPLILAARPGVKVIMASTLTTRMADISLRALRLGASDYVPKPEGGLTSAEDFKRELTDKIKALGAKRRPRPAAATPAAPAPPAGRAFSGVKMPPQVIAIGGSTGGPAALMVVFEHLKTVRQPILVTQHMPASFTAMLAEHLGRVCGKTCAEARDGEPLAMGRVYVAPGGWHMTVTREGGASRISLNQEAPEHFCRPAVDPMLRSLAKIYGPSLTAVILTGMGSDGAAGCQVVAQAGGRFITQDEATSVVWGMPAAASKTGLAEHILPLPEIGPWIARTAGAPA